MKQNKKKINKSYKENNNLKHEHRNNKKRIIKHKKVDNSYKETNR